MIAQVEDVASVDNMMDVRILDIVIAWISKNEYQYL
jgi:hypothetical protein